MLGKMKEPNIYLISSARKIKINKILISLIVAFSLLILILLIFIAKYSINISKYSKIYIKYQEQIQILSKQEAEKREKERLAKIPNLTDQGRENIKNI